MVKYSTRSFSGPGVKWKSDYFFFRFTDDAVIFRLYYLKENAIQFEGWKNLAKLMMVFDVGS